MPPPRNLRGAGCCRAAATAPNEGQTRAKGGCNVLVFCDTPFVTYPTCKKGRPLPLICPFYPDNITAAWGRLGVEVIAIIAHGRLPSTRSEATTAKRR